MKPSSIKIYITLFLLWIAHYLVDFMIGIWPVYKTMAFLDLAIAGMISAFAAFSGEGLQVFFGPLSDRGYQKSLIIVGLILTCFSVLLSYTTSYLFLLMLFLMTSVGSGAFHPAAASLAGSLTNKHKSLFITIFASGGSLGLATGQRIFSQGYDFLEGNTIWLAVPSLILIVFLLLYRIVGETDFRATNKKADFKTLMSFFYHRDLRLLYISQVCNQALFWGLIFLLPDILFSRGYDTWIALGSGHFFFVIGGALMMVPSGYLADKYSPKKVILIATLAAMMLFYVFLFVPDFPVAILLGIIFLLGASMGLVNPLIIASGNRLKPDHPGIVSAFLMGLAWCVAEGIGQGGGGLLTKLFEDDAPAKALSILGMLFLVGSLSISRIQSSVLVQKELETESTPAEAD